MIIERTNIEEMKYYMSEMETLVNTITTTTNEKVKKEARAKLKIAVNIVEALADLDYKLECLRNGDWDEEEGD